MSCERDDGRQDGAEMPSIPHHGQGGQRSRLGRSVELMQSRLSGFETLITDLHSK